MTLGTRLRTLRRQAGMSQNALAQGLVTKSMISQLEADKARPSRQLLTALAERLGVTLEELLPTQYLDQERLARYKQAQAFFALGHYRDAWPLLEECLKSPHPSWSLVEVICQTANCLQQLHLYEKAQTKYEEALRLTIRENRSEEAVAIRFLLGQVAFDGGHTHVALQEWMRTYHELKDLSLSVSPVPLEDLCLQLGTVYEELNAYEEAVRFYKEAHCAMQGKRISIRKRALIERGLGTMCAKVRCYQDAEVHLLHAVELYRSIRDVKRLYEVQVLRIAILRKAGRNQEALHVLNASLAEVEEQGLPKQKVLLLSEQARFMRQMGKREEALELLQEATLLVPLSDGFHGVIHLEMAEIVCEGGQWQVALKEAECAKKLLCSSAQQDEELLRVYRLLTKIYKQLGDYEQASQALAETNALLDKQMRNKGWMLYSAVQAL